MCTLRIRGIIATFESLRNDSILFPSWVYSIVCLPAQGISYRSTIPCNTDTHYSESFHESHKWESYIWERESKRFTSSRITRSIFHLKTDHFPLPICLKEKIYSINSYSITSVTFAARQSRANNYYTVTYRSSSIEDSILTSMLIDVIDSDTILSITYVSPNILRYPRT